MSMLISLYIATICIIVGNRVCDNRSTGKIGQNPMPLFTTEDVKI